MSVSVDKAPAIIVERMVEFNEDDYSAKGKAGQTNTEDQAVQKKAEENRAKRLWLNIAGMDDADVEELMETLTFYEGQTEVVFVKDGKKMLCSQKVLVNRALMAELSTFISENCIKFL